MLKRNRTFPKELADQPLDDYVNLDQWPPYQRLIDSGEEEFEDQVHARISMAEQDTADAKAEAKLLDEALTAAVDEIDVLTGQALPHLGTATWKQTDKPCGTPIAEQVAADLGYKGWN